MSLLKNILKEKYNLNNYQIAQLSYLFKTLASELSKMTIMTIIFHDKLLLFFFALLVMICLRCSTGGLHFYTYFQCLIVSIAYIWLALNCLPKLPIAPWVQFLLLLLCIIICYHIGPVTSKYRPDPSFQRRKLYRNTTCNFIFFYTLLLYVIPKNDFFAVGFWIIILHSLQLIIAKILKKGDNAK